MVFSYLFPERVDRLVLVASGGLGREVSPLLRVGDPARARSTCCRSSRRAGCATGSPPPDGLLGRVGLRPGRDLDRGLGRASPRSATPTPVARSWPRPGRSSTPAARRVNAHDYLPDATPIPTLVVWGTKDRMIPAWHAASRARASIANCRVELFQGAGHFPHLDDPDRFAALVREFVAEPA